MSLPRELRRALRQDLPIVPGRHLPHCGWFPWGVPGRPLDLAHFDPVRNLAASANFAKPLGGLWTSPLEWVRGACLGNMFLRWADREGYASDYAGPVIVIEPDPTRPVVVIDSPEHLAAAVKRWPGGDPHDWIGPARVHPRLRPPTCIDWEAAAAEVDALYLTDRGMRATRFCWLGQPALELWDCSTVLFLQPSFRIRGPQAIPDHQMRMAIRVADKNHRIDELTARLIKRGMPADHPGLQLLQRMKD